MGRAVANEFAKMRRLRVVPVALVMVVGIPGLSCIALTDAGPDFFMDSPWKQLLDAMSKYVPTVSPILLAVLASRPVDIEHQGNGWLFSGTSGLTPGYLCRVKFVTTGAVVVVSTLLSSGLVFALGKLVGITVTFPAEQWLSYTASIVVVNLVLFALHLLLSARIGNQLVVLGIGVLGVFLAVSSTGMPKGLAHFFPPWGYYALATPVDYNVSIAPWHLSIAALGVIGAITFLLLTRLFDRQEA